MKNLLVFVSTDENNYIEKYRYRGTYLHGQMENDYQYDIFCFNQPTDFDYGVHELTINNNDCLFYLWECTTKEAEYRGLLVYKNNLEDVTYAWRQYNNKKQII